MNIYFNKKYIKDFGIEIIEQPPIPIGKFTYEAKKVSGVDGNYYINKETVEDIIISIDFNFLNMNGLEEKLIKINNWLNYLDENKLIIDNSRFYYKVKSIDASNIENVGNNLVKKFTVNFICEGYRYLINDFTLDINENTVIYNAYSSSRPLYYIKGNGILKVNGNAINISNNLHDNLIINTVIGKVTDNLGKVIKGKTNINYMQDFYLEHGENVIEVEGIELQIKTNYRTI